MEGGVEFSVFPDGQFDFVYVGGQRKSSKHQHQYPWGSAFTTPVAITMLTCSTTTCGAVIQVGMFLFITTSLDASSKPGNVEIRYTNHRIVWVGGRTSSIIRTGTSHCTGYISPYYRTLSTVHGMYVMQDCFIRIVWLLTIHTVGIIPCTIQLFTTGYITTVDTNTTPIAVGTYRPGSYVHYKTEESREPRLQP